MTAPDAEGQHTTTHSVAVLLLGDSSMRVRIEAWVVYRDDVRARLQRPRHGCGIHGGLARAQVQRLEAAVRQPRVKGRRDGADGVLQER